MKECPICKSEYKSLGHHYSRSSCGYPDMDDELVETLTGILMGDGCISDRNKNPYMRIEMTSSDFLEHLQEKYPHFFGEVREHQDAETRAKRDKESGWNEGAVADNYSDVYVVQTYSHPDLKSLHSWYSTGEKVFPDIDLTPIILKYWYCCDGNLSDYGNLRIGCSNEIGNEEKIRNLFSEIPVEVKFGGYQIWFTKEDSKILYEYMGEPVEGFKYKWPKQYDGEER